MRSLVAGFWLGLLMLASHALAADAPPLTPAPLPASAYVGRWALQMDGRNVFILDLRAGAAEGAFTGAFTRPANFQLNAASAEISEITRQAMVEPISKADFGPNSLQFTVQNPTDPKDTDTLKFKVFGKHYGGLVFSGVQMRTLPMVRVGPDAAVAADWDPEKVYAPDDHHTTNSEMTRLFDEDQAARKIAKIDWTVVAKADAARRARTLELLNQGKLHTGADFLHAAFVFQHGDKPADYLLAHTLAMAAVKQGRPDASWIAAATLDRYLQNIGQPQVYGTQFTVKGNAPATQAPMDGKLVPDSLRRIFGVPPLAQQLPPPGFAAASAAAAATAPIEAP